MIRVWQSWYLRVGTINTRFETFLSNLGQYCPAELFAEIVHFVEVQSISTANQSSFDKVLGNVWVGCVGGIDCPGAIFHRAIGPVRELSSLPLQQSRDDTARFRYANCQPTQIINVSEKPNWNLNFLLIFEFFTTKLKMSVGLWVRLMFFFKQFFVKCVCEFLDLGLKMFNYSLFWVLWEHS